MGKKTQLEQLLERGEKVGVYVEDTECTPYAMAIMLGIKCLETRSRDTLKHLVGHKVYIIRRYKGSQRVLGTVQVVGKDKVFHDRFRELYNWHYVPSGSKYDCPVDGYKWCYKLRNPKVDRERKSYIIENKTRTYAVIREV